MFQICYKDANFSNSGLTTAYPVNFGSVASFLPNHSSQASFKITRADTRSLLTNWDFNFCSEERRYWERNQAQTSMDSSLKEPAGTASASAWNKPKTVSYSLNALISISNPKKLPTWRKKSFTKRRFIRLNLAMEFSVPLDIQLILWCWLKLPLKMSRRIGLKEGLLS